MSDMSAPIAPAMAGQIARLKRSLERASKERRRYLRQRNEARKQACDLLKLLDDLAPFVGYQAEVSDLKKRTHEALEEGPRWLG